MRGKPTNKPITEEDMLTLYELPHGSSLVECWNCKRVFKKHNCRIIANTKGNFCDKKCYHEYQDKKASSNRVIVNCTYCGEPIRRTRLQARKIVDHYCNKECRTKHKVKTIPCSYCGKPVTRFVSWLRATRIFCSTKCHNLARRGKNGFRTLID